MEERREEETTEYDAGAGLPSLIDPRERRKAATITIRMKDSNLAVCKLTARNHLSAHIIFVRSFGFAAYCYTYKNPKGILVKRVA